MKVLWKNGEVIKISVHVSFSCLAEESRYFKLFKKKKKREIVKGERQKLEERVTVRSLEMITSFKSRQQGMWGVKGCAITSAEHLNTNGSDQWRTRGEKPGEVTKQELQSHIPWITLLYTEGKKMQPTESAGKGDGKNKELVKHLGGRVRK